MLSDPVLARGLNIAGGRVAHQGVAEAYGTTATPFADVYARSTPVS